MWNRRVEAWVRGPERVSTLRGGCGLRPEGPLTHRQPEEGAQEENGQKTRRGQAAVPHASQPEQDKSCYTSGA